jgi:hypothetical protein
MKDELLLAAAMLAFLIAGLVYIYNMERCPGCSKVVCLEMK